MAWYMKLLVKGTLTILCLLLSFPLARTSIQSSTSNQSCITDERVALLSIKASLMDIDNYLSSWQGEDCCSWNGVKCSKKTGHVVKLNLRRSFNNCNNVNNYADKLGGEISNSLVNLQQLRYLDLSCNIFHGAQIPAFLGSMKSLRYLNLSYTLLHGRIPPQVGNLTKLIYLDLKCWYWYNDLNTYPFSVGLAWLSQLFSLKYLDMSYVNISTAVDWVHQINMLPALEVLNLRRSGLRNTVPSLHQFNLTALKVLDISENYFDNKISPNWFWNATSLTILNIGYCSFYGPIPDEIGRMKSLEQVSFLENNLMSTMIPSSFKNLCKLTVFVLDNTNTTGDITVLMERLPNCHWNKLQKIDLSRNNIGGELPDQPGPLTNLTYFILSDTKLTGKIPSWIGVLRKLYILDLSWNHIYGTVNEDLLNSLTDLKYLRLSGTLLQMKIRPDWIPPFQLLSVSLYSVQLGPAFPSWLKSQTSVENLLIPNTSITAIIPDWFWVVFSGATFLDLAYNQISGALPATLEFMAAEYMAFSNNRLSGTVPRLPRYINTIDISRNFLSGPLPSDFGAPRLEKILLYNNSISGTIPSSLCSLKYLEVLDLSGNMLTGEVPNCQLDMNYLFVVNLNLNNISGEFPPFFTRSPNAIFVDLSDNQFSGNVPLWIWEKMPSIALLRLRSNKFDGSIPNNGLSMCKGLQFLDLAHNKLTGSIPPSLVNLSAMARTSGYSKSLYRRLNIGAAVGYYNSMYETIGFRLVALVSTKGQQLDLTRQLPLEVNIDLSCNGLTGVVPQDIGTLVALKGLNLSWNRLSGEIPVNIGQLNQLESLDFSHNEMSGVIPPGMSALTSLSFMNLSYNDLSGKIPTGNQFVTFGASSYIGNIGLCGRPLTESCPGNASSQDTHGHHLDLEDASLYLAMVAGFVLNLWAVFFVLLFKRSWRNAYFVFVDEMHDKIYVTVILRCASLKKIFGQA